MDVSLFDFDLPEERIALRPASPRDSARMLVVREDGSLTHARVRNLPEFLRQGDLIVINDSKVIPARLHGRKVVADADGPAIELLLYRRTAPNRFLALARPARKLHPGDRLQLEGFAAEVCARQRSELEIAFDIKGAALDAAIARTGEMPLPPYIARRRPADARDVQDYQTVFAAREGSSAAPTAGLHFTPELLATLEQSGVAREQVTLHVGPGTFLPVTATETAEHRMHSEWVQIGAETAKRINADRARGGRIVAVGTTALRTIETAAEANGTVHSYEGESALFITPGYRFKTVDVLLTNFHLPRSTLFMLVCAFCGLQTMKRAYAAAIAENYRFYSYGDACLLFRRRG
ncbi:MAG TPA: tRNA preQ1(34) S-adenosylmethionine ribosyltransferase-isomerase QueA [Rhizomicrobium sp.]|jgi:S-adenosylmethionine:tRNA ribosyltransferase-isomerase|nr:tRNA preQ1(34) S-adenosylmethionine ribosyltransferase-isomerase QueA [Rhizomicrobium sp.]